MDLEEILWGSWTGLLWFIEKTGGGTLCEGGDELRAV
jgi:hypothetical protein